MLTDFFKTSKYLCSEEVKNLFIYPCVENLRQSLGCAFQENLFDLVVFVIFQLLIGVKMIFIIQVSSKEKLVCAIVLL